MLEWNSCAAVERSPERVSGAWVFKGTRIPVRAPLRTLQQVRVSMIFSSGFPGVTREEVLAVLAHAERSLAVA